MDNVVTYNTNRFGAILQNSNADNIVCISWSEGDDSYNSSPEFIFFPSLDDILIYITRHFSSPYELATVDDEDLYARGHTILVFDNENMSLRFIAYKTNVTVYQFYRGDVYNFLKENLSIYSIPRKATISQYSQLVQYPQYSQLSQYPQLEPIPFTEEKFNKPLSQYQRQTMPQLEQTKDIQYQFHEDFD
jgi:hypothetical protein